jgi:hypothetical protein
MRKVVYISVLIMIYLLLTAKSCDNREQRNAARDERLIDATKDSISTVFESDTLSNSSLRAFEATAEMKLFDISDYLKIQADSTIGKVFKNKTEAMIHALFVGDNEKVALCIAKLNNLNLDKKSVEFDSVEIDKPLQKVNDSLYSGQLRFLIYNTQPGKSDKNIIPEKEKHIEIYLIKQEKVFGRNSLKVWAVIFGDID